MSLQSELWPSSMPSPNLRPHHISSRALKSPSNWPPVAGPYNQIIPFPCSNHPMASISFKVIFKLFSIACKHATWSCNFISDFSQSPSWLITSSCIFRAYSYLTAIVLVVLSAWNDIHLYYHIACSLIDFRFILKNLF